MGNTKKKKSGFKNLIKTIILAVVISFAAAWLGYVIFVDDEIDGQIYNMPGLGADGQSTKADSSKTDSAAVVIPDSLKRLIHVSRRQDLTIPMSMDPTAGRYVKRVFSGRRINIAVIGVDARLGSSFKHGDANHVISILSDQGQIEITSIPRDTPADCGYEDSTGQNKLTVLYAMDSKKNYFKKIADIAGLDHIHYYIEVGFSQVMGLLELLGFKDTGSALQVLRSRSGLGGSDYQRSYNQGQFIRQTILKHFNKTDGFFSEILLRGGLSLVNTNLTASSARSIVNSLKKKGFPKNESSVTVRIRPKMRMEYKVYDLMDTEVVGALSKKIQRFNLNKHDIIANQRENKTYRRLNSAVEKAVADSAKKNYRVLHRLTTYFKQRAWLQVADSAERYRLREQIGILLSDAYRKQGKTRKADKVLKVIENEKRLFSNPVLDPIIEVKDTTALPDSNNQIN